VGGVPTDHGRKWPSRSRVSVRGRGMSEGRQALRSAMLAHYVADVLRALAEFSEPPIVVVHSLGALLAQRLLGRTAMRALVMLAPLPPEGMLLISGRLMVSAPAAWFGMIHNMVGFRTPTLGQLEELVFSDRFTPFDVDRHRARMVIESMQVLPDSYIPLPTPPVFSLDVPTLVIARDADRLVMNEGQDGRGRCRPLAAADCGTARVGGRNRLSRHLAPI
jgi:pimeloyl-ACP methyl ester carboxylesterase